MAALGVAASVTVGLVPSPAFAQSSAWVVVKDEWSASDEKNYSAFIEKLGTSGCNRVDQCLKSPANPYRGSDPRGAHFFSDCAKFPYLLRTYFAWKNGLPFSYESAVKSATGGDPDLRYSKEGNIVTARRALVARQPSDVIDGMRAINLVLNEVNSAMFRVHPYRDGVENGKFQDFYPARINRQQVRPGTLIYDPAGHVAVVYKVEDDGRIRYFDAHPDATVSHGVFGEKFARSRPGSGAGFKNFRSLKLTGASRGPRGEWTGGTVTTSAFANLSGYSVEQYFGTEAGGGWVPDSRWRSARFVVAGTDLGFQDFVRTRLAVGELKYHPIEEMRNAMDALCGDIRDRVIAIDASVASGLQNAAHPDRLPKNIYGTSGPWEEFSSPSRDARLKTAFVEIRQRTQQMVEAYRRGDTRVVYEGQNLGADLRATYEASAAACKVTYRRSNGQALELSYDDVVGRLFRLSFDPYHCVELRWGANSPDEMASCAGNSGEKAAWYRAEQRLRNQIERTYDLRMDFSIEELERGVRGSGVDKAPDVDLRGYLSTL